MPERRRSCGMTLKANRLKTADICTGPQPFAFGTSCEDSVRAAMVASTAV